MIGFAVLFFLGTPVLGVLGAVLTSAYRPHTMHVQQRRVGLHTVQCTDSLSDVEDLLCKAAVSSLSSRTLDGVRHTTELLEEWQSLYRVPHVRMLVRTLC